MGVWSRVKEFWNDNKRIIIPVAAGIGGAVGGYFLCNVLRNKSGDVALQVEEGMKALESETNEEYDCGNRMLNTIMDYEKDCEKGKNFWYDAYRKKWDMVSALAQEMDDALLLGDGEFFVIEGINPDLHEDNLGYYVHHMIDDMPSYPPEMVTEES